MNRKIEFRGKRINHDWILGDLSYSQNEVLINGNIRTNMLINGAWVIPDTVGQFTGLLDKNGKEIYEGDILADLSNKLDIWYYPIEWSNEHSGFGYRWENKERGWSGTHGIGHLSTKECQVIGNIHDNPELLNK